MFSCELHPILYRINVSVKSSKLLLKRSMSSTDLKEIFQIAVESVQPQKLIRNELKLQCRHLLVRGECYQLRKPCYIVGFGKAVLGMATEIENVLGDQLERGVVAVPVGIFEKYKGCNRFGSKIEYIEGAKDNLPDKNAEGAAQRIKNLVEGLTEEDLLIVLISGGGSSLLPLPVPPITLEEKVDVIKKLAKRGADICELNTVRKKISLLKGGGLAEVAYPCKIISLVLSDIVGDPLDFIASGPTIPTAAGDSAESAVQVLKKYHLYDEIPDSIKLVLYGGKDQCPGRVPVRNGEYEHVKNYIIGNNTIAAEAARSGSINKGLQSVIVSTKIDGDVNKISKIYARIACNLAAAISDTNKDDLEDFLKGIANDLRAKRDFIQEVLDMDFTRPICLIFAVFIIFCRIRALSPTRAAPMESIQYPHVDAPAHCFHSHQKACYVLPNRQLCRILYVSVVSNGGLVITSCRIGLKLRQNVPFIRLFLLLERRGDLFGCFGGLYELSVGH